MTPPNLPANETVGFLIRTLDGQYCFRVYDRVGDFVDYDLLHNDLMVKIVDADSAFYMLPNGRVLDHAPATLGYEPLPQVKPTYAGYQCSHCGENIGYLGKFLQLIKFPYSHKCEKK